jgi:hypothetical protein
MRVAELVDMWYISWKDRMTTTGSPHSLGFAKEELKNKLISGLIKLEPKNKISVCEYCWVDAICKDCKDIKGINSE